MQSVNVWKVETDVRLDEEDGEDDDDSEGVIVAVGGVDEVDEVEKIEGERRVQSCCRNS